MARSGLPFVGKSEHAPLRRSDGARAVPLARRLDPFRRPTAQPRHVFTFAREVSQ